jgi:NADH dehydrogenase
MWQIATRQRTALLITGRPDQHLGVDVGLMPAERSERLPATVSLSETPAQEEATAA